MRVTFLWPVSFALVASTSALVGQSDSAFRPAHRASVQRLFAVTHVEAFHAPMLQLAASRYAEVPALAPFAEVMRAFVQKHASFAAMEDDLIKLYSEAYSEVDVMALIEFYETPLGQRLIAATPRLAVESAAIASKRIIALLPELMKELGLPPPG